MVLLLHDLLSIPNNGVGVKVFGGIKPEIELLLSVSFALSKDIRMNNVRVTTKVSQEFKVNLIMCGPFRRQLQFKQG